MSFDLAPAGHSARGGPQKRDRRPGWEPGGWDLTSNIDQHDRTGPSRLDWTAIWIPLRLHLERIDRARAAGSDIGLPCHLRRALALIPRPGDDRGGPVDWTTSKPAREAA